MLGTVFQIRSHILRSKLYAAKIPQKPTGALSEVCGEFTVVRRGVVRYLVAEGAETHQIVKTPWSAVGRNHPFA